MTASPGPIRVAVLMGGPSSEHDISMRSGQQVLQSLTGAYQGVSVIIQRTGEWSIAGAEPIPIGRALDSLKSQVAVAFVALHGPFGEDGTVQGALDAVGIPYTGSGVLGSSLAMDKVRAKEIYSAHSLPVAASVAVTPISWSDESSTLLEKVKSQVGFPCVLKPAASGSSYGVSFPKDIDTLRAEIEKLLADDVGLMLIEKRVLGPEFSCGVLDVDERPQALPVIEIIPDPERYEYFDLEAKYLPGATQEITPARISDELTKTLQDLAVRAHQVLDCRDFSRTDFLIDKDEQIVLLETNTVPGLTAESLLPKSAKAAGYTFASLISLLVDNAHRRGTTKYY
jgi:D-alanine-D-alanine ligase